jgi:5-methylcytosine-specific restriction endonuclease McrA
MEHRTPPTLADSAEFMGSTPLGFYHGQAAPLWTFTIEQRRDVHIDHIVPYSLGGPDELYNLQVAHSSCNIRKGARG